MTVASYEVGQRVYSPAHADYGEVVGLAHPDGGSRWAYRVLLDSGTRRVCEYKDICPIRSDGRPALRLVVDNSAQRVGPVR